MSSTVRGAAAISLSIDQCWQNLRDLTRARDYVPGLTDTVITTDQTEGIGASRVVTYKQFGEMDETVVEWDEGIGMTVRLHKGSKPATPFKEATFRYEFRPTSDKTSGGAGCEIHTSMTYELPFGVLGRVLDRLLVGRILRQSVVDSAVCLAENYRTNRPVPSSELSRLRANAL